MAKVLPWAAISTDTIERLITDLKDGDITPGQALLWLFVLVMTNACDRESRGLMVNRDDEPLSLRALERLCGLTRGTVRAAIKRFNRSGWIERTRNGNLRIRDFESWVANGSAGAARRGGQKFPGAGNFSQPPGTIYPGVAQELPGERLATAPLVTGETDGEGLAGKGEISNASAPQTPPNCAASAPIQLREENGEKTNVVVGEGVPSLQQQPTMADTLPGAVAVPFVQAVGRPFDARDEAVLRDLVGQGHDVEEVVRAIHFYGRTKNAEMRRAGLRYVGPMIKKGMFRPGVPTPQFGKAPQVPSGNIRIGHTPELTAQRRARRLALQNKIETIGGNSNE